MKSSFYNSPRLEDFANLKLDHFVAGLNWIANMGECHHWNLSNEEIAKLLGLSDAEIYIDLRHKAKLTTLITVDNAVIERISLLLGIWKYLQLIAPIERRDLAYKWFDQSVAFLKGQSIKEYLIERNDVNALYFVNHYLRGMCC